MEISRSSLESIPTRGTSPPPSDAAGFREDVQPESAPISRRPTNIELSRADTHRLQQQSTVGSKKGRAPKEEWLPFGLEKDYPPDLPHPEKYVVEFAGEHDLMHPHNWPTWRK